MYTLITNNELVKERYGAYGKVLNVEYLEDAGCLDVLIKARDAIHGGSRLETHPMAGSIKPNQNPYKTVMISDGKVDPEEFQEFITVMENKTQAMSKLSYAFIQARIQTVLSKQIDRPFIKVDSRGHYGK